MRRVLGALIVAAVAASALAAGARADSRAEVWTVPRSDPGSESMAQQVPTVDQTSPLYAPSPLYARVTKPFGAVVRVLPSSDAAIMFSLRCGDLWPVDAVERGWFRIRAESGSGWVGGSRVVVASAPAVVDCSEARFIHPDGFVSTFVVHGCLSLRSRPAADAPILACVENGHVYAVLDGPFDPGTDDDWFRVSSPSTGSGWAPAAGLYLS